LETDRHPNFPGFQTPHKCNATAQERTVIIMDNSGSWRGRKPVPEGAVVGHRDAGSSTATRRLDSNTMWKRDERQIVQESERLFCNWVV
jgi:hypothetical protein